MAYYGAPGSFGGPPGAYGGYPPQSSSPPGMAPGMAPGMGGPPGGMDQGQHPLPARPGAYPSNFQIPPNMPKFDMNASVIRLGTNGPQKNEDRGSARGDGARGSNAEPLGQRRGLGMDRNIEQQRQQIRESMQALMPPKSDEVLKTIFVGNITEGCRGDAGIEELLRVAGNLRKWTRAYDADNKPCTFGFAEYEDSESLETAAEVLKDVYVPVKKQLPKTAEGVNGNAGGEDEVDASEEVDKVKLLVVVDDASKEYAENWAKQRGDTEEHVQRRRERAQAALQDVLARFDSPYPEQDFDGDVSMQDLTQQQDPITGEVISVPIAQGEDELSMVPAEMRETVLAEIAAFRDRSNRRDLERLKKEEEMEARDRNSSRSSIPTGPGGANGIPVGPKGIQNAPSGPKGLRGVQIPKDYQNGVSFTNGSNELASYLGREDDDTDASDSELEKRRRERKAAEQEKQYLDYERKWLNRERTRGAALERERHKDENEEKRVADAKESMGRLLKDWDDDRVAERAKHEYYADRGAWARHRAAFRARELQMDAADRAEEERDKRVAQSAEEQARGMAMDFLDQQAEELGARGISTKPQFKISLGAAAQKARQAAEAPKRKAAADVENLLDVDELAARDGSDDKRTLVPIKFDTAAEAAALTDEERAEARRQLAYSIPQDKDGLFHWDVKWSSLRSDVIEDRLKPYVEKRSLDLLGVVEELVWDVVVGALKSKEGAAALVGELEDLLGEETEGFVKKLWRMVVFYSESESRGLGGEGGD